MKIRWWEWPHEKILANLIRMNDVNTFIAWAEEEAKREELPGESVDRRGEVGLREPDHSGDRQDTGTHGPVS